MKKTLTILGLSLALLAVVAGIAASGWWWRQRANTYYTDTDTIQEPIQSAPLRDILWSPARDLGASVNAGAFDDTEPALSGDGSELYFVRTTTAGDADIYVSRLVGGAWAAAQPLSMINSPYDDLGPEPSRDGAAIYFYSNRPGGAGGYDLWVTRRGADGWIDPENLGDAVNTFFNDYDPAISGDGALLYFASNRPTISDESDEMDIDSFESRPRVDYDLFRVAMSQRFDQQGFPIVEPVSIAVPVNELNTQYNEVSPAISPFGDFVYFASDRTGGAGGFDLYRARMIDGVPISPQSLGDAVNSKQNEIDPALDRSGFGMYFASDRPYAHSIPGQTRTLYTLYFSTSREVFRETAAFDWRTVWNAIWPSLLWLLLAVVLLFGLLVFLKRFQYRRMTLIARCLLASMFVHVLVLFLMSLWGVTTSLHDALRDASGTRIALTTSAHSDSLSQQIRGTLTEVVMAAVPEVPLEQEAVEAPLLRSISVMALLSLAERTVETVDRSTVATQQPGESFADEPAIEFARNQGEVEPESAPAETAIALPATARVQRSAEAQAQVIVRSENQAQKRTPTVETTIVDVAERSLTALSPAETARDMSEAHRRFSLQPVDIAEAKPTERMSPYREAVVADAVETEPTATDVAMPAPTQVVAAAERAVQVEVTSVRNASPAREANLDVSPAFHETVTILLTESAGMIESSSLASAGPAARKAEVVINSESNDQLEAPADQMSRVEEVILSVALPADSPASSAPDQTEPTIASNSERLAVVPDQKRAAQLLAFFSSKESLELQADPLASADVPDSASSLISSGTVDMAQSLPVEAALVAVAMPRDVDQMEAIAPKTELPELKDEAAHLASAEADIHVQAAEPNTAKIVRAPHASRIPDVTLPPDITMIPQRVHPRESSAKQQPTATLAVLESMDSVVVTPAIQNDSVAAPELARIEVSNFPSIDPALEAITLPYDKAVPRNPLEQRDPEVRAELVKERGGDDKTEKAVALALKWLADHQSPDGKWDADNFDPAGEVGGETAAQVDIAITGLSLLAFLASDYTHIRESEYQDVVARAIDWLVQQQQEGGSLLGRSARETMYSHGIATIALAEAFAMTGDPELIEPVLRAVDFIVEARNREFGGWRYVPQQPGDTSVTGWQVMAMASAARSDIEIPRSALQSAARWIETVRHPREPGRYAYQPGRQYTNAMTAEAMFMRQILGVSRNDRDMQASAQFLLKNLPDWKTDPNTYYWYYGTLAMFHYQGAGWERWNRALKRELIENQRTDAAARGSWDPVDQWSKIGGRVYQTAMCALCLEVYYRYNPVYSSEEIIDTFGIIQGSVTDAMSDDPIEGALVSLDVPGQPSLTTRTDEDGHYLLSAPEMPEFFALSASKRGYGPQSAAASARELRGRTMHRDFELSALTDDVIAIEDVPRVHHLGNNLFEGRINSQFQGDAEGTLFVATFNVGRNQVPPNYGRAVVRMIVKGAQARNQLRVNGHLVRRRMNNSPTDGSYGDFAADLPIEWLERGENEISIKAVNDTGDIDDFEFVNIQIYLFEE